MTDGPETKRSDAIEAADREPASNAKAERDIAENRQTQPPERDPPMSRESFKSQVEAHLAVVSRDETPHPVDLAHAIKFILETMLRGL